MLIPSCLDSGLPITQIEDVKNQLQLDEDRTQLETPKTVLDKTGQVFAQWEGRLDGSGPTSKRVVPIGVPYIDIQSTKKGLPGFPTNQTIPFVTTYYSSVYWYR